MKKFVVLFVGLIGICLSDLFADEYKFWRSTEIVGAQTNVRVATGTIVLKRISVLAGVSGSKFQYFTATGTISDITRSSSVEYNTSTTDAFWELDYEYLPGGFFYTNTGTSTVRITWDWTKGAPQGLNAVGYKVTQ